MDKKEIIAKLQTAKQERDNMPKFLKVGQPIEVNLNDLVVDAKTETVSGQYGDYEKKTYTIKAKDLMTEKTFNFALPEWLYDAIETEFTEKNFPDKITFVRRK